MTAQTVAGLLDESAANRPGRPLLRDTTGESLTVADVAELSAAATHWLVDVGVRQGMTVALTSEGWFRSGDKGHMRPEGRIVVTGRPKDLIIRKGENIAPDEIENELLAHPLVDEVAVMDYPDELRGEMVCAVVRRSPRHRDVTLDELCAFPGQRGLMKQKWPERLVIVDEFPLTGLGKVAKTALAEQIAGGCR